MRVSIRRCLVRTATGASVRECRTEALQRPLHQAADHHCQRRAKEPPVIDPNGLIYVLRMKKKLKFRKNDDLKYPLVVAAISMTA